MCGIIGIYSTEEKYQVAPYIRMGLITLQHRGQEAAGIATYDGNRIRMHKAQGVVTEAFDDEKIYSLFGCCGIGHTRYSTTGASELRNAQPTTIYYTGGELAIAHNGNLVNGEELKRELEEKGHVFLSTSDTEIIGQMLAREYLKTKDLMQSFMKIYEKIDGSYSLLIMTDENIYAIRDPYGIKPMCLGKKDDMLIIASETPALDTLGAGFVRDIEPGEIVKISKKGITSRKMNSTRKARCMFEYVYFARPDTVLDGKEVFSVRKNLGKELAKRSKNEADIVIGVPFTGISAAIGYSEESGIPNGTGLMKNNFIGRTFIMPTQSQRENTAKLKYNPILSEIKDKRVIVLDDSVVRGTTIGRLIKLFKGAGAKEVHLRVTCPPIKYPCFYGIDMATRKELIASHKSIEEIRKIADCDSLIYQDIEGLVKAIGFDKNELCMACLTGEYPTQKVKQLKLDVLNG